MSARIVLRSRLRRDASLVGDDGQHDRNCSLQEAPMDHSLKEDALELVRWSVPATPDCTRATLTARRPDPVATPAERR
jgi:hypothetical protein